MASTLSMNKIVKLRHDYFLYVYKKYVYNVFTELHRPKNEQVLLGMMEHNTRTGVLERYIEEKHLSNSQKEVVLSWKNEIYGSMHILCFDKNKVFVYCKERDTVYHVLLLEPKIKEVLRNIPFTMPMGATIFPIYNTFYFDSIINVHSQLEGTLQKHEELYEHIYSLMIKDKRLLSDCFIYSTRSLKDTNFSKIFLDYIGPLSPLCMEPDELEIIVKIAYMVWNDDVVEEIDLTDMEDDIVIPFLRERKRKYFSHIDRIIVDYKIIYDDTGFELKTASKSIEEYKKASHAKRNKT